jgi:hypothetical protein
MRAAGHDPSNSPQAARRRAASLSQRKREELSWQPGTEMITAEQYRQEVQPTLRSLPLSALQAVTGLSVSACSRIRSGQLMPHARRWGALAGLVNSAPAG